MEHQPLAELEKLLISLLTEADVRRIVRLLPGGEDIHAELPGTGVSLTALVHQAVSVLERHGRLDGAFFEALVAERPARRDEIQALAARMPGSAAAVPLDERHKRPALDADNMHGGRSYTRHQLGQVLPEGDAEVMSEITTVTRSIAAVRAPAHKNQRKPTVPATDPLAQALEDALARKQRLETAGLPVTEVLDEIRKLKRELRCGGVLRPGDVLGHHYLLAEQIGQGGFGTVWRARDRRTNDDVAVKVLHTNLAGDTERRQRFFRGARIMAELGHPAVTRIRQVEGEDDGFHYFVMDFLTGGNLQDAVLAGRLPRAEIEPIILRVGEALTEAHKRGIVHRDVKPSNILLDGAGQPYLTDFDLVTASDTTGGTRTGAMGTFLYAPPEMLERPQDADARADVYGLGMTMAFMLHGEPLPHASVRDASSFVKALACAAPYRLVLGRAVAWKPEDRLADAGEFCQSLRAAPQIISSIEAASVYTLSDLLREIRSKTMDPCPILVGFREFCLDSGSGTMRTKGHEWDGQWDKFLSGHSTSEVFLLKTRNPAPGQPHPVTIGRSNRCDVRIPYGSVSRMHASVLFDSGSCSWFILDHESRHGTHVTDQAITPGERVRLRPGDLVSLGTSAFWFVDPAALNELATLAAFSL